jgi:hypothetical protein
VAWGAEPLEVEVGSCFRVNAMWSLVGLDTSMTGSAAINGSATGNKISFSLLTFQFVQ